MTAVSNNDMGDLAQRLSGDYAQLRTLESIENLLWLVVFLLIVLIALVIYQSRGEFGRRSESKGGWLTRVEDAYNKGDYETAMDILDSTRLLYPASAWVDYWQGRCYFQMERWEEAATTFEELLRREPIFRSSVKEYLAFIELNALVDGISGYVDPDS